MDHHVFEPMYIFHYITGQAITVIFVIFLKPVFYYDVAFMHRGEVMYISLIDFQWTSTETKSFQ